MVLSPSERGIKDLEDLGRQLASHPHSKYIERALGVLLQLGGADIDRLDWKILAATLQDLEQGFEVFYPYRHIRKVAIFGSARTPADRQIYQLATDFAACMAQQGFMAITGAGDGIMAAGNQGAGRDRSFGLNIRLPFEQGANEYISDDPKLISFKYFFTRKLFFCGRAMRSPSFQAALGRWTRHLKA